MKPVLFVTGHAPPDRVGAFARLHEREDVRFAFFGGRVKHGTATVPDPSSACFPTVSVAQRAVAGMAASGQYRAVVCGTAGRVALPAAWLGARRARVPFVLWSSLWSHPFAPAHVAGYLLMLTIYSRADAVVTYGPHVTAYVRARGARNVYEAPQAVDNEFWSAPAEAQPRPAPFTALFVGRTAPEKGLDVLLAAWRTAGLDPARAALVVAGSEPHQLANPPAGVTVIGAQGPRQLRNLYAASDVLIMPSLRTRTFREPWGLVANEAFNQACPVIASDAVGAAAGGLVRHERNGLIVRAGDPEDLAAAIVRLERDRGLARQLGSAGAGDVASFTPDAWAAGFSAALRSVGASREPC
jgi:glycosyltransferase involved in cell wall biosynthesis